MGARTPARRRPAALVVLALVAAGCGANVVEPVSVPAPPTASPTSTTPAPEGSPSPVVSESPPAVAERLELGLAGVGGFAFGDPMTPVVNGLVELLGEPVDDVRMHGDMPMGWGDVDTTVRLVDFGGLRVVFQDWEGYFRDDGVMHLVSWSVDRRRTPSGALLVTTDGISVRASVPDLVGAFGSALHLPDVDAPGCAGPPWLLRGLAGGAVGAHRQPQRTALGPGGSRAGLRRGRLARGVDSLLGAVSRTRPAPTSVSPSGGRLAS